MAASRPRIPSHDQIRKPGIIRPSGVGTVLSEEEATANAAAIDSVVKAFGGKQGMLDTLSVASDVPEVDTLLRLVLDPRYDQLSLRRLCHLAGLTIVDLFTAYKKAMVVKAHLIAYQAVTDHLLPVVEDVMKRAAPYEIICYGCAGQTSVTDPEQPNMRIPCPDCGGKGKLLQLPDLDRQKLALELAQLVQKASGFSIQQNNLTVPPPDPDPAEGRGTLIALQHALHELQQGPRTPIVEGTVLPTTEADPSH